MGKLIDADALIAQIWAEHKKVEESYDLCVDELKEVFCGIVALVDEQPTAYDPDRVVKQLEKEMQTSTSAKTEAIIGMCGASANHYGGEECAYQRAIEIVKGGGVDG